MPVLKFDNLLSNNWITRLRNELFEKETQRGLNYEGDMAYYGNSFGIGSLPIAEDCLRLLTPLIIKHYGSNLQTANSYSRIYYNGSVLKRHVDRQGLDITMSLCVFSDIEKPWPIYVEADGITHEIDTPVNSAAVLLGTKHYHFRDPLVCRDDQKVAQIFFHWTRVS